MSASQTAVAYPTIPRETLVELRRYAEHRVPTGDFLRAVLENNLMEAMGRVDLLNRAALCAICFYVHNEMPMLCHGSPEKVAAWLRGE